MLLTALTLLGWWWGSARLDALDRSVLLAHVDTSERSVLMATGPARRSKFELRVPAQIHRFGRLRFREAVLLELPLSRSPPQGALIETIVTVRRPKPPKNGFDETTWLRLTHRTDASGEHEVQASTSRDGRTWVHGGVWTFPAGSTLRIGLVSHGLQTGVPATSRFDYFRVYAD